VDSIAGIGELADVVFLTVPDDAIAVVESDILWAPRHLAIHCSGAQPASILHSAEQAGARIAGFHPLQTFADVEGGLANLAGSAIGIEADERSWPWLEALAASIQTRALRIPPGQRALYHAAAVLVSNGTVGLVSAAADLWHSLGVEREAAVQALLPLLRGTLRNLESLGIPDALTGPVVRGDTGTIERQIEALAAAPHALAIYASLAVQLIELAIERGTITAEQAAALRALVNEAPPRGDTPLNS
jgi:predicted short-subunit dehydrogenase-like oxidoreductase (DUF2520 family)